MQPRPIPSGARVLVTRRMTFAAAHRLHNPAWDDARNRDVFGYCNNPNGHGHNYVLEVTVSGRTDPDTGYVVDLKLLKDAIQDALISRVDHKHLNHDVDFLAGINPTVENLIVAFWGVLAERLAPLGVALHRLRLHETENNVAEYSGELE
jgi:6-pyruvoyltetrahydropterin/6-carboxytetrahydropterin synthase